MTMRIARSLLLALFSVAFATAVSAQAAQSHYADVNGIRVHYLQAGSGEPVVLLHGFAETSHMWRPLIRELAQNHTVIAPDLRGYGSSSAPAEGYTKAAMARDVHALVTRLGHKRSSSSATTLALWWPMRMRRSTRRR